MDELREPDAPRDWHSQPAAQVLRILETDAEGLHSGEAALRRVRYGPNRLPEPARRSALRRLAAQFNNVLIYVLLSAAVITAALSEWTDTGVILGVVVINALIGFIQEGKA